MRKVSARTIGADRGSRNGKVLSLLAILCFWAIFNHRVLFEGHTFVLWDDAMFYHPLWKWGASVLGQGLIPLWNPGAGFGVPYLADPRMAVWYPPLRLFYLVFSPEDAFRWALVCHSFFGLVGFLFFCRSRGLSSNASLAGSLVFGFSIHAVCLTWNPDMLFGFSWMPWVFNRGMRLAEGKESLWPFSVCAAMQMASGFPILSGLTLGALVLESLIVRRGELLSGGAGIRFKVLGFLAALLLAGAFNLAWILSFLEFMGQSTLSARMGMSQALPFEALATWLNPFYTGHPLHRTLPIPFEISCYFFGIPALVALLWGIGSGKLQRVSWILFLLWILLSLGETVWLAGWLKNFFPPYHWIVRSGYLMPLVVFQGARLTAESTQAFIEVAGFKSGKVRWVFLSMALGAFALFLGVPSDLWTFWAALLFLGLTAFPAMPAGGRWICFLFSVVFSLAPPARSLNFTIEKEYYQSPPKAVASLSPPGRIYHPAGALESMGFYSGDSLREAFGKMKLSAAPNLPLGFGLEELDYSDSIFLESYLRWFALMERTPSKVSLKLLDYLGVRYAIGKNPSDSWAKVLGEGEPPVFKNENMMPKWFSVPVVLPQGVWERDLAGIGDPKFGFSRFGWASDFHLAGQYQPRLVRETGRTPNSVTLEALGEGKAFLFSSEAAYPGWRAATVESKLALEEVNHGFRGVVLENGQEKVSLLYRPTTFRLGCFFSLLVCGVWIGMALRIRKNRYA